MSRRFSSISSAEGAGPYLASMPRPVLRGLRGPAAGDSSASFPSQALRVRPCAAARAMSAAAWASGISITVIAGSFRGLSLLRVKVIGGSVTIFYFPTSPSHRGRSRIEPEFLAAPSVGLFLRLLFKHDKNISVFKYRELEAGHQISAFPRNSLRQPEKSSARRGWRSRPYCTSAWRDLDGG